MAGGAEENLVPRCRSAVGVGCWIGRVVMRPKVGLGFDNPASQDMTGESVDEQLPEQARSDELRRMLKEAPRQQLPGQGRLSVSYL